VARFMPRSFVFWEITSGVHWISLGEHQNRCGRCGQNKCLFLVRGVESLFPRLLVSWPSCYTDLTTPAGGKSKQYTTRLEFCCSFKRLLRGMEFTANMGDPQGRTSSFCCMELVLREEPFGLTSIYIILQNRWCHFTKLSSYQLSQKITCLRSTARREAKGVNSAITCPICIPEIRSLNLGRGTHDTDPEFSLLLSGKCENIAIK
jgi:hypothetical protein